MASLNPAHAASQWAARSVVRARRLATVSRTKGTQSVPLLSARMAATGLDLVATFAGVVPSTLLLVRQSDIVAELSVRPGPAAGTSDASVTVDARTLRAAFERALLVDAEDLADDAAPAPDAEVEAVPGTVLRLLWAWDREADAAEPTGAVLETGEHRSLREVQAEEPVPGIRLWTRPVGRAQKTRLHVPASSVGESLEVRPYVTQRGLLALAMNRELRPRPLAFADSIDARPAALEVRGRLRLRHDVAASGELVLRSRIQGLEFTAPLQLVLDRARQEHDFGRAHYDYRGLVSFPEERWDQIDPSDQFDAFLRLSLRGHEEPVLVRVSKVPFLTRAVPTASSTQKGGRVLSVAPYFTFKAKALSARLEVFSAEAHAAATGPVPPLAEGARVWLIGEMPYKAQDNGAHFFRWMRTHHPEIDAYYVLDASSEERDIVGSEHVIEHGSAEHFRLALQAERFVGTHHAEFLYPTRNPAFVRRLTGARVFLQHGVMGTKWMVPNYGKRAAGFETDLFLASSEREKRYLVDDFGYAPEEVLVTGLSRFDTLLAPEAPSHPRQLLVMPTWRDWLQGDDETFLGSEYFAAWRSLLSSEAFANVVREQRLEVVLCLHPNMQRFTSHFADLPVTIVQQGERSVQELMMESACMLTDYSSVGFDFSFQHRPVIYFQFDREAFIGPQGSHIDLDAELPGVVCRDAGQVLAALGELAAHGFEQSPELRARADRFLDHRDTKNSERVYEAVLGASRARGARDLGEIGTLPTLVYRRFRRHRVYFPLMKAWHRLLRLLPVQDDVLVFESGLGTQFADSPRYLYEELVRRGDTRRKVWVYKGPHRFTDPHTEVIERLSPAYYRIMSRAGMWTLNQSAPFYLRRHRDATYVQTWHGTPLKRMQHDIEEVHGRTDDYLDRVEAATAQWTHLLSPSGYATEAFRSAFRYKGPVVEEGYPRNDPLLTPGAAARGLQVRAQLGVSAAAPVILYAPTFRDDQAVGRGKFSFELPFDLDELVGQLPEGAVLLLRMHVLVADAIDIPEHLRDRVIDVSRYSEIQELYLASDVLVTDYSSVFFDAALLRKPIVFHAYDLENYRDSLRGFYLDYERDLPGRITQTTPQLAAAISDGLRDGIDEEQRDAFLARFAPHDDGHASARVVDVLYETKDTSRRASLLSRLLRR